MDPIKQTGKVRIGIVAEDPLRALGLQSILQELSMEAIEFDLQEALADTTLSVLLLDGAIDEMDTLETVSQLRRQRPELKTIIVSESLDPEHIQALIGSGAKGFLTKTATESELRMALEVVLDGSIWAPRKVLARLIEASGSVEGGAEGKHAEKLAELITPRESEVLQLLTEGRSNREIAGALNIDEVTVKAHLGRMLRKAGVSNRVELTLRALEEQGTTFSPKKQF